MPLNAKAPAERPVSDRFRMGWDVVQLLIFVAATVPAATGVPWHEWLGLAFVPLLLVHLLNNWEWIVRTTRCVSRRLPGAVRFNQVWNAAMFVTATLAIMSGLLSSRSLLYQIGVRRQPDSFWGLIHSASAISLMVMVGVHLGMHARWVYVRLRKAGPPAAFVPEGKGP